MDPIREIASLLKISDAEAQAYCKEVRACMGLGKKRLPDLIIAVFVTQHKDDKPTPERMAEILRRAEYLVASMVREKSKKEIEKRKKTNNLIFSNAAKRYKRRQRRHGG